MSMRDRIAKAITGIRAFHGSPHDFDKFDLSKVGSGEGAQAYGRGLYFAGSEDVARSYRDTLAPALAKMPDAVISMPQESRASFMRQVASERDPMEAAKYAQYGATALRAEDRGNLADLIEQTRRAKQGRMYEVNINAKPEELLDWDKPITAQGGVLDAVKSLGIDPYRESRWYGPQKPMGGPTHWSNNGYFVREVPKGFEYGKGSVWDAPALGRERSVEAAQKALLPIFEAPPKVGSEVMRDLKYRNEGFGPDYGATTSEQLRNVGIPGVRYLDEGSRGMTSGGTSNYAMFDDRLIDVMRKYGVAGAAPVGMGALAAQDQYQGAQQ